jgi:hypothetical protein
MELIGTSSVILTEIGATIVTLTVALTLNPAEVEDAVITTTGSGAGFGAGTVGGAVKVAACPLAVWVGETEPQGLSWQVTDQVTPEFVVSFTTAAVTVAIAFVSMVPGGA